MLQRKYILLLALSAVALLPSSGCARSESAAPPLYTYSFGGLEDMPVEQVVSLLGDKGYAGIAVEARGDESLGRLDEYFEWSDRKGDSFNVVAAFMSHRFDKFGLSDEGHRKAIDRLAPRNGTLWVWVRDAKQDGSITDETVESFIVGIFEYAKSKGVKVILYPHYNTYYPTVEAALPLVKKVDHPDFRIALNLCHELMSDKGDQLAESFEMAKPHLGAVILSGALNELDRTSVISMNASTIHSLDESEYDLRPFLRLVRDSGFDGPVGFINFKLASPEDYLSRSMKRWQELCREVGLHRK